MIHCAFYQHFSDILGVMFRWADRLAAGCCRRNKARAQTTKPSAQPAPRPPRDWATKLPGNHNYRRQSAKDQRQPLARINDDGWPNVGQITKGLQSRERRELIGGGHESLFSAIRRRRLRQIFVP